MTLSSIYLYQADVGEDANMDIKASVFHLTKTAVLVRSCVYTCIAVTAYESESGELLQNQSKKSLDTVSVGRLTCVGHLPLAVLEKQYQDQLNTFELQIIQNHSF